MKTVFYTYVYIPTLPRTRNMKAECNVLVPRIVAANYFEAYCTEGIFVNLSALQDMGGMI